MNGSDVVKLGVLSKLLVISSLYSSITYAEFEVNLSGFGTLGYAVSNKDYAYQRYINNQGTVYPDSLLAGQVDIKIARQLSATFQVQLQPDASKDSAWNPNISWAFLSYRPSNDWLVRGGKLRVPGYLNSENRDVGVSFDYVRVPGEFDSISPTYDFTGISINKTFALEDSDIFVDVYAGVTDVDWRTHIRDDVPGYYDSGRIYNPIRIELLGVALKYQTNDDVFLSSIHHAKITNQSDLIWVDVPVYKEISPGVGYYSTNIEDGAVYVDSFELYIATLGADIDLGSGFRLASELGLRKGVDLVSGLNSLLGYVSIRKNLGNWTPYLFYSQIKSDSADLAFYHTLNSTQVPNYVPGYKAINSSQRARADVLLAFDQYSVALGTSYNFSAVSKLKAEVMLTHINEVSSLIDAPEGSDISNSDIGVFSLSYSFVF